MHRLGLPPSGPRGIVFVTQFNPFLDYQHYFEPGDPIKYRNSVVKVTRKGPLSLQLKSCILAALPLDGGTRITPSPRRRGAFFGSA